MTDHIRVAAACVNQIPLDWQGNLRRIKEALTAARADSISVVCFPELSLSGYGCEDQFHSQDVAARSWQSLEQLLPETKGLIVAVGLPVRVRNANYNGVAVLIDGSLAGIIFKQNLAGDGLHYEPRWFHEWPAGAMIEQDGVPMGDFLFVVGGVRIGLEICEDAWVADRPGRAFPSAGVEVILNPSASHFAFGKQKVRHQFAIEGSRAFGAIYVYANLLGNESGRSIYDGAGFIASAGRLVAEAPRLNFTEWSLAAQTVDLQRNRMVQVRTVSREVVVTAGNEVAVPFAWPAEVPVATSFIPAPEWSKEEAFTRAAALALFDYMRKSWSNGFVVSLSGGADSAAISVMIRVMLELAVAELGWDQLRKRLSYLSLGEQDGFDSAMKALLFTAYQGTRNSSDTTRHAAASLAEALGSDHAEWEIDTMVETHRATMEQVLGRPLDWQKDDIALQNIQARVRAPGIWMMTNIRNALLCATSNRSEAAVGYATMDGDTSGGLSPISGIDKHFLRQWLRWYETEGLPETGPIPALHVINAQQPTAELRPLEANQTDEEDLMPYPVLTLIEHAAVHDKKSPLEVFEAVRFSENTHSERDWILWITRFFKLWSRNQWKRERYAVSFHYDDFNLDPRSWCRFPVLSSGFREELAELEEKITNNS